MVESTGSPLLRLRALTRLPGAAYLGVTVEPRATGARGWCCARSFDPAGPPGHAYWWANLATHRLVFARMADRWAGLLSGG